MQQLKKRKYKLIIINKLKKTIKMSKTYWQRSHNLFLRLISISMSNFFAFCQKCVYNLENHIDDPVIEQIYNNTLPVYEPLEKLYAEDYNSKANRRGKVITLADKFNELTNVKLIVWEAIILQQFIKKSAEYSTVFPYGKAGIRKGSYKSRLKNLKGLRDGLVNIPSLASLLTDVSTFYDEVNLIYKNREMKQNDVEYASTDLKEAANKMAVRLFVNLGLLTAHFAENPEYLHKFFPLSYIKKRKKSKTEKANTYNLNIDTNTVKEAGIIFSVNDTLLVAAIVGNGIKLWFSQTKDISIPINAIEILADEEAEIVVKNYAGIDDRFMMIANLSTSEQAVVEITLLDNA